MTYEELLLEAESLGLIVKEKPLKAYKGRIKENKIAIKKDLPNDIEKKCILVEEVGHHLTTVGDILDQTKIENRKKERLARAWGYTRLIGLLDLINAKKQGIRNRYELAEYLGVTEEFVESALKYYKEKYGSKCTVGDYTICFDSLEVYEKIF